MFTGRSTCRLRFCAISFFLLSAVFAHATLVTGLNGSLSTAGGDISASGTWDSPDNGAGLIIDWAITEHGSYWHYKYEFTDESSTVLNKLSHFIFQVSDNVTSSNSGEIFSNFTGDSGVVTFDDNYVEGPGNPGLDGTIYGIKVDLAADEDTTHAVIEFDALRAPMWGDFYAKGGVAKDGTDDFHYAYNKDIGIGVAANYLYLYDSVPIDANGELLSKILVPDSHIPEPATMLLFGLGGLILRKRKTAEAA